MPRRIQRRRATREFLDFLRANMIHPKKSSFITFSRDGQGLRFDDHEFEAFFNGAPVSERILQGLIAYCRGGMLEPAAQEAWTREFSGLSSEEMLAHVSTETDDDIDMMAASPQELAPWIKDSDIREMPSLSTVERSSDIMLVACMVNASCGRSVRGKQGARLSESEAVEIGLRHRGVTMDECVQKFTEWHEAQPKCIRFCVIGKQRIATSICLSLTAEAYADVRNGRISDFDIDEQRLRLDTGLLMNEALGEASRRGIDWLRPRSLSEKKMILRQIASLTSDYKPFQILGFDGSPEAKRRLRMNGFKETGFVMPRFGNTIFELNSETSPVNYWLFFGFVSTLRGLQRSGWK